MTREEIINQVADDYANDSNNIAEWGDGWEDQYVFKAFKEGAKWADKHPKEGMVSLDKACEWLEKHYINYMIQDLSKYVEDVCSFDIFSDSLIEDFRKAMEE